MIRFRRITSYILSIAVIMSCTVYAFAYNINNQVSEIPLASSEDLEYISNLGSEKYNHLLNVWCEGVPYSGSQEANYPPFYGGCYEDEDKYLVIAVTSLDQEVIDYFGSLIDLDYVRFSLVRDSYQELLDGKAVINQLLRSHTFGDTITNLFTGTGIAVPENAVNIYMSTDNFDSIRGTIEEVYSANSDKQCNLRFVSLYNDSGTSGEEYTQPYLVNGTFMEPGGPIRLKGDSWSVGFWARDYFGNLGVVTANHGILSYGNKAYGTKDGSNDDAYFGYVTNTAYSGAVDASFIQRVDDRFGPITYVDGWNFNLKSETINVRTGQEVFKRGIASGATRGVVLDPAYDLSAIPGSTVNLTAVVLTDCYAEPGDSGGIVASGGSTSSRYVAGIIGGAKINSNNPSERYMYYSPASNILAKVRVTLY